MGKRTRSQREARMPYTGRDLKKGDVAAQYMKDLREQQVVFNREAQQALGRQFGNVKPAPSVKSGKRRR